MRPIGIPTIEDKVMSLDSARDPEPVEGQRAIVMLLEPIPSTSLRTVCCLLRGGVQGL